MADLTMELDEDYDVMRVKIDGQLNILSEMLEGMKRRSNRFDLAIIARPDSAFDPKDQVILDQFIMNGGRVLWLVDPMLTNRDSLATSQMTMSVQFNKFNLEIGERLKWKAGGLYIGDVRRCLPKALRIRFLTVLE